MSNIKELTLLKEIENIFNSINSKIDSLNECSSEDFTNITLSFKKFYSEIQELTTNIKGIFNYINFENEDSYEIQLQKTIEKGKELFQYFEIVFPFFISIQQKHPFSNNHFFIFYNNLRQDLNTLRLFLAKQRLTESTNNSTQITPETFSDISKFEIESNLFQKTINTEVDKLRRTFRELYKIISSKQYEEIFNKHKNLPEIKKLELLYKDKKEITIKELLLLKEKNSVANEQFSTIITNLQYHDIIRQKIEHIQFAHNQAHEDLIKFRAKHENNLEETHINSIGHIADIADIQAAQLLQANKEYQSAIKLLIEKLNNLSDIVCSTSDLGKSFIYEKETFYKYITNNLETNINDIIEFSNNSQLCTSLLNISMEIINSINTILENIANFKINTISNFSSIINSSTRNSTHLIRLKDEVIANIIKLENYFSDVKIQLTNIDGINIQELLTNTIPNIKSDYLIQINQLKQLSNDINNDIIQKLKCNLKLSKQITNDIQKSIRGVKFYDYFEEVVTEAINSLNSTGKKLLEIGITSSPDNEKLEKIKQIYTMASERHTYEEILHTDFSDDIDNEDDVEFF